MDRKITSDSQLSLPLEGSASRNNLAECDRDEVVVFVNPRVEAVRKMAIERVIAAGIFKLSTSIKKYR